MLNKLNGYKVYATCAVGLAAILYTHFVGPIPNVQLNDTDWLNNIWYLVLVMTGRSAMPDKKGII